MKSLIIGTGNMAVRCADIILNEFQGDVEFVLHAANKENAAVINYCNSREILYHEIDDFGDTDICRKMSSTFNYDIVFNINSMLLFPTCFLSAIKTKIVNFHNSPLPYYKGLNVCSWAIVNQESSYGATWHYIEPRGIDSGNIIEQKEFPITSTETASSLILKCASSGIDMFHSVYAKVKEGYSGVTQGNKGSIYFKNKSPNDGYLDLSWDFERMSAFVRGLTFRPFNNTFVRPKLCLDDIEHEISSVSKGWSYEKNELQVDHWDGPLTVKLVSS